jgi:hypothetical protein
MNDYALPHPQQSILDRVSVGEAATDRIGGAPFGFEGKEKGLRFSPEALGDSGGADRDRTDGLLNAIQALSQLSYSPTICKE